MTHTYIVRVNFSFTKLNGHPFFGTYQAWYKYTSNSSMNGTFPDGSGPIVGKIYFAPAFFPVAPDQLGVIADVPGSSIVVAGGKVTAFNASTDYGGLSINLSLQGFDFAFSTPSGPGPHGSGSVEVDNPIHVP